MVRSIDSILADEARVLADDRDTVSRGDSKRSRVIVEEMLSRLATELVELSEHRLAALAPPEPVLVVVRDARAMKHGAARNRQLRLVRRELRDCDWFALRARLQHLTLHGTPLVAREGADSGPTPEGHWTVRLLSEGDAGLDAFLEQEPGAERNHMRGLLRETRKAAPERRARAERRLTAAIAAVLRSHK